MAQYTESTLRNRAEKLGYKVEKGYQKLAGNEYGFLTDGRSQVMICSRRSGLVKSQWMAFLNLEMLRTAYHWMSWKRN